MPIHSDSTATAVRTALAGAGWIFSLAGSDMGTLRASTVTGSMLGTAPEGVKRSASTPPPGPSLYGTTMFPNGNIPIARQPGR